MRISDWSSDVCSSDLFKISDVAEDLVTPILDFPVRIDRNSLTLGYAGVYSSFLLFARRAEAKYGISAREILLELGRQKMVGGQEDMIEDRSEEHTSELQSLMRISYAVFCLKKKNKKTI